MRPEALTIVYKLDTFTVESALDGIQTVLAEHRVPLSGFEVCGKPVNLAEALAGLKRAKRKTFNITGRDFRV